METRDTVRKKSGVSIKAAPMESYTAERLYKMRFQDTAYIITKMDTTQKAMVAAEINPILESLYGTANRYGNPDYESGDQIGPAQFQAIMSKIKHWETLLYWLYEIDLMIEEAELRKLAKKAEEELQFAEHNMIKLTSYVQGSYEATIQHHKETVPHTEEIMDMAAQLAKKYFK